MPYWIEIVPSARDELTQIRVFYRRIIAKEIESQLAHEPTVETKNRKLLFEAEPSFECEPPVWELRVGDFLVFYDVDESATTVYVRAIREKPPHASTEEIL